VIAIIVAGGTAAAQASPHVLPAPDPVHRLTLPWNSGVAEGNDCQLEMLKRPMYGRATFALLRKRVLLTT
jgi:hypothetical protein